MRWFCLLIVLFVCTCGDLAYRKDCESLSENPLIAPIRYARLPSLRSTEPEETQSRHLSTIPLFSLITTPN